MQDDLYFKVKEMLDNYKRITGHTQAEIAANIGINQSSISRILAGKAKRDSGNLRKIYDFIMHNNAYIDNHELLSISTERYINAGGKIYVLRKIIDVLTNELEKN